jgi:hypothetical protein
MCKPWRVPGPPSISKILREDLKNSLKAVTCVVMIDCRESTQIKINKGKKDQGEIPESTKNRASGDLSSCTSHPWHQCVTIYRVC